MTRAGDDGKTKPSGTRAERLAAALRENLRRRKAQARSRSPQQAPANAPRDEKAR
jgi:hypothetical protein